MALTKYYFRHLLYSPKFKLGISSSHLLGPNNNRTACNGKWRMMGYSCHQFVMVNPITMTS